jgi:hypothetical protein
LLAGSDYGRDTKARFARAFSFRRQTSYQRGDRPLPPSRQPVTANQPHGTNERDEANEWSDAPRAANDDDRTSAGGRPEVAGGDGESGPKARHSRLTGNGQGELLDVGDDAGFGQLQIVVTREIHCEIESHRLDIAQSLVNDDALDVTHHNRTHVGEYCMYAFGPALRRPQNDKTPHRRSAQSLGRNFLPSRVMPWMKYSRAETWSVISLNHLKNTWPAVRG